jgi:hypothetical protein
MSNEREADEPTRHVICPADIYASNLINDLVGRFKVHPTESHIVFGYDRDSEKPIFLAFHHDAEETPAIEKVMESIMAVMRQKGMGVHEGSEVSELHFSSLRAMCDVLEAALSLAPQPSIRRV